MPDGSRMIVPCNAEPPEIAPPGKVYICFFIKNFKAISWSKHNVDFRFLKLFSSADAFLMKKTSPQVLKFLSYRQKYLEPWLVQGNRVEIRKEEDVEIKCLLVGLL